MRSGNVLNNKSVILYKRSRLFKHNFGYIVLDFRGSKAQSLADKALCSLCVFLLQCRKIVSYSIKLCNYVGPTRFEQVRITMRIDYANAHKLF